MNELTFPLIWGMVIILSGWFCYKIITAGKTKGDHRDKQQDSTEVKN